MTDFAAAASADGRASRSLLAPSARTRRRNSAERRFRSYGLIAITLSLLSLAIMLSTIFRDGAGAFWQARLEFPVTLDPAVLDPRGNADPAEMAKQTTVTYGKLLDRSFAAALIAAGIDTGALTEKDIGAMVSKAAPAGIRDRVLADPSLLGQTIEVDVLATGRIDGYLKGRVTRETAARDRNVSPAQLDLADRLVGAGLLAERWNWDFITGPDASDTRPESAGLGVALIGSVYMMLLVLVMCVPVGIAASIYLEEFAPKNAWTDLIEVNIANLAAVPSIVFGILGLAVFINFLQLPQSSSLAGALVISLMTLPTIIIATRSAIRAVPPSVRDAALGIGASKMQTVFHHVLPLAMPGILTGTILGLATALGETAPLLLIGMVAFVTNYPAAPPEGFLDPATALPVQVYNWASRSDPAFIERSNGAIIVLLIFLLAMNLSAILLRRRFERRW